MLMLPLAVVIALTLLPFLELRASIPYGILQGGLPWWLVFLVAVLINIGLGPALYITLEKVIRMLCIIKPFERFYHRVVERTQRKAAPYVHKYGPLGLALFIGVPLPGSGVYSGAIAAHVLGMTYKEFFVAVVCGVLIAATAVTAITLSGMGVFSWAIKTL
ncbi:small multidrug export protein [Candidatus Woesearchaeota archaeon]|nr:MAG: small multidrug export protein [Candidatus Woesearchaeota archaeon]